MPEIAKEIKNRIMSLLGEWCEVTIDCQESLDFDGKIRTFPAVIMSEYHPESGMENNILRLFEELYLKHDIQYYKVCYPWMSKPAIRINVITNKAFTTFQNALEKLKKNALETFLFGKPSKKIFGIDPKLKYYNTYYNKAWGYYFDKEASEGSLIIQTNNNNDASDLRWSIHENFKDIIKSKIIAENLHIKKNQLTLTPYLLDELREAYYQIKFKYRAIWLTVPIMTKQSIFYFLPIPLKKQILLYLLNTLNNKRPSAEQIDNLLKSVKKMCEPNDEKMLPKSSSFAIKELTSESQNKSSENIFHPKMPFIKTQSERITSMLDLFPVKEHRNIINIFTQLTAKLDDSNVTSDNPFLKMTRSPYHLVAWFLIFAATNKDHIDIVIENLRNLCLQNDITFEITDLKFHIMNLLQSETFLEALSQFKNKIKIELDIEPQKFIDAVRTNGYENLAKLLELHDIVRCNKEVNGLRITTLVDPSVQWKKALSDDEPGFLTITEDFSSLDEGENVISFFVYDSKKNRMLPVYWWDDAIKMAAQRNSGFDVIGEHDSDKLELEIPTTNMDPPCLRIEIPRCSVGAGLYQIFIATVVANIGIVHVEVFFKGEAFLDKLGASATQTQEVELFRCSSPVSLRYNFPPSALFLDTMIAANFTSSTPNINPLSGSILIVELKTVAGDPLLLIPYPLSSLEAKKITIAYKQQDSINSRLLNLVNGKIAEKKYTEDNNDFKILSEILRNPSGKHTSTGLTLYLNSSFTFVACYGSNPKKAEANLKQFFHMLFSNTPRKNEVEELVAQCHIEQKDQQITLTLTNTVINTLDELGIEIPEPLAVNETKTSENTNDNNNNISRIDVTHQAPKRNSEITLLCSRYEPPTEDELCKLIPKYTQLRINALDDIGLICHSPQTFDDLMFLFKKLNLKVIEATHPLCTIEFLNKNDRFVRKILDSFNINTNKTTEIKTNLEKLSENKMLFWLEWPKYPENITEKSEKYKGHDVRFFTVKDQDNNEKNEKRAQELLVKLKSEGIDAKITHTSQGHPSIIADLGLKFLSF